MRVYTYLLILIEISAFVYSSSSVSRALASVTPDESSSTGKSAETSGASIMAMIVSMMRARYFVVIAATGPIPIDAMKFNAVYPGHIMTLILSISSIAKGFFFVVFAALSILFHLFMRCASIIAQISNVAHAIFL